MPLSVVGAESLQLAIPQRWRASKMPMVRNRLARRQITIQPYPPPITAPPGGLPVGGKLKDQGQVGRVKDAMQRRRRGY